MDTARAEAAKAAAATRGDLYQRLLDAQARIKKAEASSTASESTIAACTVELRDLRGTTIQLQQQIRCGSAMAGARVHVCECVFMFVYVSESVYLYSMSVLGASYKEPGDNASLIARAAGCMLAHVEAANQRMLMKPFCSRVWTGSRCSGALCTAE